ncbi:MAG: YbaN family protein, partial [Alphaproteobacteria bacterium]
MIQETLPPQLVYGPKRYALLVCGWTNVALGMIGAVVPVMQTTVFLLIALWAFTRSSPRCRAWLYNHPKWGPTLVAWSQHGVIPPRAKCLALASMIISFIIVAALAAPNWIAPLCTGVILTL